MTNQHQAKHFNALFITPGANGSTRKMAEKGEFRENNKGGNPALGSARAVKQYNRQKKEDLIINYQRLFIELARITPTSHFSTNDSKFDADVDYEVDIVSSISSHEQAVRRQWMNPKTQVRSVKPFVRIPCSDLFDCADQLQLQRSSVLLRGFSEMTKQRANDIEPKQQSKFEEKILTSFSSTESGSMRQIYLQQMSTYWNNQNFLQKFTSNLFQRRIVFNLEEKMMEPANFILDNDYQELNKSAGSLLSQNNSLHAHLHFESRFESGNLWKAIQVDHTEYELILSADINAPSNPHFQWFYFAVSAMQSGIPYTFEVINCVKSVSMFSQGMQPVLFSVADAVRHGRPGWRRAGTDIRYFQNLYSMPDTSSAGIDTNNTSFTCKKSSKNGKSSKTTKQPKKEDGCDMELTPRRCTRSATAAAKALKNNANLVESLPNKNDEMSDRNEKNEDSKNFFSLRFTVQFPYDDDICYIAYHYPYSYTRLQSTLERWLTNTRNIQKHSGSGAIYFERQELCRSLMGNSVPLLTITSCLHSVPIASISSKQLALITARVHPGETNSSWIMHGIIQFLLSTHPIACHARELFIFKLIPMLNPDGVINGSHRCSLFGQDLNRVWNDPSPLLHPTIFHTKGLIQYAVDILNRPPFVFIDLHGHSRKSNIFMYGNNPEESWRKADQRKQQKQQQQTERQENTVNEGDNVIEGDVRDNQDCHDQTTQEHSGKNKRQQRQRQQEKQKQQYSLLPEILDKISDSFALKDCVFSITKSKEYSARVATWRQFRLPHAYTMESTYFGFDNGPKAGTQITITDMKRMGAELVEGLVRMHDIIIGKKGHVQ